MTLKDLKALLKVLRDNGVTYYEQDGVKLSLLEQPVSKVALPTFTPVDEEPELTPEQILLYSSQPPTE